MIRYALVCDRGHEFDSWFRDAGAYDAQERGGLLACPACGSEKVAKAVMAPRVARTDRGEPAGRAAAAPVQATPPQPMQQALLSPEQREFRAKLKELRDTMVKGSDDVGSRFAEEARKMHFGEIEHRTIHGQANPQEARSLIEDGVPFHPLPVVPDERN